MREAWSPLCQETDDQQPGGMDAMRGGSPASQEDAYLLGLRLHGRRVVVVGGGAVAARRVPRLLAAGADVALVSPAVTPALEELAAQGRIDWRPRAYAGRRLRGRLAGHRLRRTGREVNAAVADEAEANRTWCVRADDAAAVDRLDARRGGRAGDTSVGVLSGRPPAQRRDPRRDHGRAARRHDRRPPPPKARRRRGPRRRRSRRPRPHHRPRAGSCSPRRTS